jgi:hypothetical protein
MRFQFKGNVARLLVMAVLLSVVACSELPELARLMDNPSNDFMPPSYPMEQVTSAVAAQVTATVTTPAPRITRSQESSGVRQQTIPIRSSRDLLELYTILRT